MNQQKAEKIRRNPDGALEVHHVFKTIQGEGPFAGTPAIFVRLAGCNLQCPWCDTDYTSRRGLVGPSDLLNACAALSDTTKLIVITGGEPLRQGFAKFAKLALDAGWRVQVETNGTLYDPELPHDHERFAVVCSPKTPVVHAKLVPHLAALKYVLDADNVDPEDGLPASTMGAAWRVFRPGPEFRGEVYVQPLDVSGNDSPVAFVTHTSNRRHTEAAVASAIRYGYRLCIQTHKLTGLE